MSIPASVAGRVVFRFSIPSSTVPVLRDRVKYRSPNSSTTALCILSATVWKLDLRDKCGEMTLLRSFLCLRASWKRQTIITDKLCVLLAEPHGHFWGSETSTCSEGEWELLQYFSRRRWTLLCSCNIRHSLSRPGIQTTISTCDLIYRWEYLECDSVGEGDCKYKSRQCSDGWKMARNGSYPYLTRPFLLLVIHQLPMKCAYIAELEHQQVIDCSEH